LRRSCSCSCRFSSAGVVGLVEEEEEGVILVFAGFSVVVVTAAGWVECSISQVDVEHVVTSIVTSIVVVPGFRVAKRCVSDKVVPGDDI